ALLPDTSLPIEDAVPGTMRHVQRMREISIQVMVEGTAQARVRRALGTKTRSVGQSYDYKIGDLVDFHRAPSAKYVSGLNGLANIIDNTNLTRGTLKIRFQRDLPIEVRLQDVRRHLDFFCFMAAPHSLLDAGRAEWARIRTMVDELPAGKSVQVGMTFASCGGQSATTTTHVLGVSLAWLSHFAYTVLQFPNVTAVMYGRGVGHIQASKGYASAQLMWPQGQI
ncbi:MAG: hypothetical protein ACKPKO_38040, partial [Candidatus Fonsibacter sp.]